MYLTYIFPTLRFVNLISYICECGYAECIFLRLKHWIGFGLATLRLSVFCVCVTSVQIIFPSSFLRASCTSKTTVVSFFVVLSPLLFFFRFRCVILFGAGGGKKGANEEGRRGGSGQRIGIQWQLDLEDESLGVDVEAAGVGIAVLAAV